MIARLRQRIARLIATYRVRRGHAQRICAPGQWVVWLEGRAVKTRILQPKGN